MARAWTRPATMIFVLSTLLPPLASAQAGTQRSLQPGIAQTRQQLNKLDQAIQAGINDDLVLETKLAADLVGGGALVQLLQLDQHVALARAIGSRDYAQALSNALEEIIGLFAEDIRNNAIGNAVSNGVPVIDAVSDFWELYLVLRERAQMIETRDKLFQQLIRLEGKDPQRLAEWGEILTNLHGNPGADNQAFQEWLANHRIDQGQVAQRILKKAAASNSSAAARVGAGAAIVDPDQGIEALKGQPCINPDFIAALEREQRLLSKGDVLGASLADKYPGGGYIPAFTKKPCQSKGATDNETSGDPQTGALAGYWWIVETYKQTEFTPDGRVFQVTSGGPFPRHREPIHCQSSDRCVMSNTQPGLCANAVIKTGPTMYSADCREGPDRHTITVELLGNGRLQAKGKSELGYYAGQHPYKVSEYVWAGERAPD
jgi:hypothetical protein